jgi:intracellular multiplication protein IcmL
MAGEKLEVVRLKDDFYKDGFFKILIALFTIITAVAFLFGLSIYLYTSKPAPVYFSTDDEWRILPPIPLDQVYLSTADLAQWVSDVLPNAFTYDFINYTKQLEGVAQYFTENGWQKFLEQVNTYANYNTVMASKSFINARPAGAPFVISQGLLDGRYAWWIQMPLNVNNITAEKSNMQALSIRALIVRVPTLNNIYGIGIENIIVSQGSPDQVNILSGKGDSL